MSDVFISYSRKDKVFARRLFDRLEREGLDSWADWEGITGGEDWWRKICAGIDSANTFVLVISPDSLASHVCNLEIEHARQTNKRIIPILRREPDVKYLAGEWFGKEWEAIARKNLEELQARNYVQFRKRPGFVCEYDEVTHEITNPECDSPDTDADDFETAFQTLIRAARQDPEYVSEHTRLLVRAQEWEAKRGGLLSGAELTAAEAWLAGSAGKDPKPADLHRNFIAASRLTGNRRLRTTIAALVVGIILAIGLAIFGLVQAQAARTAQAAADRRAEEAQSISWAVAAREVYAQGDTATALALALEANRIPDPPALAQSTLADIAYNSGRRRVIDHSGWVSKVAFNSDGRMFFSVGENELIIWDAATESEVRRIPMTGTVLSAAFSPDARFIVTGGMESDVILWDGATGGEISRLEGNTGRIWGVAFSHDGRFIVSSDELGEIILWDAATGSEIHHFNWDLADVYNPGETIHVVPVYSVAFSPDGRTLLSSGDNAELLLWDVATGNPLRRFLSNGIRINSAAFSPDGRSIVAGSDYGQLVTWDVMSGEVINNFDYPGEEVLSVAFSPDGQTILSGGSTGDLILWSASGREVRRFVGLAARIYSIAFSPDGRTFLSSGENSKPILWDVASGGEIRRLVGHDNWVGSVDFSPDGRSLISGGDDGKLILWDVASGNEVRHFVSDTGYNANVTFSPDGRSILSTDDKREIILWDVASVSEVIRFVGHTAGIYSLAFSPGGRTILSSGGNSEIILWDVATGHEVRRFTGHTGIVYSAVFSPDGQTILSSGDNSELILWDVATGHEVRRFIGHTQSVYWVVFKPDGRTLLSSGDNSELILWDVATGHEVRRFTGHAEYPYRIAFSPDGRSILTGTTTGELTLWSVATGDKIRSYRNYAGNLADVAFSPDGHSILSFGYGAIILWRFDTIDELIAWTKANRAVPELTCDQRRTYSVTPLCDGDAQSLLPLTPFPTSTIPVWTPIASPTVSDTPMPSDTPTPSPTFTPPTPTWTPSTVDTAQVGENHRSISIGERHMWTYEGQAGEILTISVNADVPVVSGGEQNDSGIDTYAALRSPDGSLIAENDDRSSSPHYTDSLISNITLPADGVYEIEVADLLNDSGGGYTLIIESSLTGTPTPAP